VRLATARAHTSTEGSRMPSHDRLYPRIRRGEGGDAYPRRITDGLEAVLAVADSHRAITLDSVAALGPIDDVWATATANLRALPPPQHDVVGADSEPITLPIHVLEFDDFFGPSRLLIGTEFFAPYVPSGPAGLLVAVPDRHTVLVTPATGHVALRHDELAATARDLYELGVGAVSPFVYHLGADDQVTEADATRPPEHDLDHGS
jgi:hypothetical protein